MTATVPITVRAAATDDVPLITGWRRDIVAWLAERGTDQWAAGTGKAIDLRTFTDRVTASIAAGETWMAQLPDEHGRWTPVGTIAVDEHADSWLWQPGELDDAVVAHRMITAPGWHGRGVGDVLLDHADQVARARGKQRVCLDAWTTNTGLHDYYLRRGFVHVRTVAGHTSSALFARDVT